MKGNHKHWSGDVFREMRAREIATVCTIPDGGLTQLLNLIDDDKAMRLVTLTSEQEGIGIATGCWLGGQRAMIAMQSSGVGNCINALGLPAAYRAPCLMLGDNARAVGRVQSLAGADGPGDAAGARSHRREVLSRRSGRGGGRDVSPRPPTSPSTAG
jgi:hypothetical protein